MISYLRGTLIDKQPPTLVLEVGAVGYLIQASMQTFYQLPALGATVSLYTLLFIKEDTQWLYGFISTDERKLFQELLKVNTIGPKAALAILSNMDIQQLHYVIVHQDVRALQRIPGIGRKTAERLLLELTDRLSHWQPTLTVNPTNTALEDSQIDVSYSTSQDAIDALISLGYKLPVAARTVNSLANPTLSTEELIRLALSQLGKS